jgi:hypothetical protein
MKTALPWPPPKNWHRLWPALKGSLAKVAKPCIRPGCPQCAKGTKHPAHILSFSQQGERHCMYVPQALVKALQAALANGRRLEALLYAQGPRVLKAFRQQRQQPAGKPAKRATPKAPKTIRTKAKSRGISRKLGAKC